MPLWPASLAGRDIVSGPGAGPVGILAASWQKCPNFSDSNGPS